MNTFIYSLNCAEFLNHLLEQICNEAVVQQSAHTIRKTKTSLNKLLSVQCIFTMLNVYHSLLEHNRQIEPKCCIIKDRSSIRTTSYFNIAGVLLNIIQK